MKRSLVFVILSFCVHSSIAQVKTNPTAVRPSTVTIKTIPSATAITIRKDTRNLQVQLSQLNDSLSIMKGKLDVLLASMKTNLDSTSEMSQEEQLALQRMMEQLQKTMAVISNLMKQAHDTQMSIISNLKG